MKTMTTLFISFLTLFFSCNSSQLKDGIYAEIETNKGKIVVKLEYQKTPITVANFISLAEGKNTFVKPELKGKPYYDGLKFHRVIKDFMVQGGDPEGSGSGGPGYKFKDEITDLSHSKGGILSMANAGPETNGSQFFITHRETPWLDGKHTVFGEVIEGMNVVNAIEQNDVIKKITIVRKGSTAKLFNAEKTFSDYVQNQQKEKEEQAALTQKIKNEKVAYFEDLKKKASKSETGLLYHFIKKGNGGGTPKEGENVFIHYAGYLENGELFDTSYREVAEQYLKKDQRKESSGGYKPLNYTFTKNQGGFIAGFSEGLTKMSFGDKIILFIPSYLGYGERGAGGVIPPNANIVFEVELIKATPEENKK
jgi:peptidyl-prolyl cis-trans isomerase A (cyclophilin A)